MVSSWIQLGMFRSTSVVSFGRCVPWKRWKPRHVHRHASLDRPSSTIDLHHCDLHTPYPRGGTYSPRSTGFDPLDTWVDTCPGAGRPMKSSLGFHVFAPCGAGFHPNEDWGRPPPHKRPIGNPCYSSKIRPGGKGGHVLHTCSLSRGSKWPGNSPVETPQRGRIDTTHAPTSNCLVALRCGG